MPELQPKDLEEIYSDLNQVEINPQDLCKNCEPMVFCSFLSALKATKGLTKLDSERYQYFMQILASENFRKSCTNSQIILGVVFKK